MVSDTDFGIGSLGIAIVIVIVASIETKPPIYRNPLIKELIDTLFKAL